MTRIKAVWGGLCAVQVAEYFCWTIHHNCDCLDKGNKVLSCVRRYAVIADHVLDLQPSHM